MGASRASARVSSTGARFRGRGLWVAVLAAAALVVLLHWSVTGTRGLTRRAIADADPAKELAISHVTGIDLRDTAGTAADRTDVTVVWRGAWEVPASDLYSLALESHGPASWLIDGHVAHAVPGAEEGSVTRIVWLPGGFHDFEIRYRPGLAQPHLAVLASPVGETPAPLSGADFKPRRPRNPWLRQAGIVLRDLAAIVLVILSIVAIRRALSEVTPASTFSPRLARPVAWLGLALVLSYGALLRVDAITARYGPVSSPAWLAAVQTRAFLAPATIRPAWFPWTAAGLYPHKDAPPSHYISDPYTYLGLARNMRYFYQPEWREPLFPNAVRIFLWWLHDQDVAVSFTSAAFSLLAIWFTYILGSAVWSRPVGLMAAIGMALDRDVVWFSSQGWRDDAYVAAVTIGAYLILRCWRIARRGSRLVMFGRFGVDALYLAAIGLGAAAGAIILVRFMAFAFLIPAAVILVLSVPASWKYRATLAALGFAAAAVVAGPYFINCWRIQGDFFYTFNVHGNIYRVAEGKPEEQGGTLTYIREKIAARPFGTLDTIARGVTTYPFLNKWEGLDAWHKGLGRLAALLAVGGMALLLFTPAGRLLLIVGVASLLPFSLTWQVDPNPRFTAHVFPILLIAGAVAVSVVVRIAAAVLFPWLKSRTSPWSRDRVGLAFGTNALAGVTLLGGASAFIWFVLVVSPQLVFAEGLRVHDGATVSASNATGFFGRGWLRRVDTRNTRLVVALSEGEIDLRLPAQADYTIAIALQSFPRPLAALPAGLPVIEYALNGEVLGALPMQWNPDGGGACEITLPKAQVRSGLNRFVLRVAGRPGAMPGVTEGDAFALRSLRVK